MNPFFNHKQARNLSLVALSLALAISCAKPKTDELYPPEASATCYDAILNQGEYQIDCGGPCAPCPFGDPYINVTIDSTWIADSLKKAASNWTPGYIFLNYTLDSSYIWVTAVDSYANQDPWFNRLMFRIDKNYGRGVHEIIYTSEFEHYQAYPQGGQQSKVSLESGVIKITNRDDVNFLISGEFEFNSGPDPDSLYRTKFKRGVFKDIPLK